MNIGPLTFSVPWGENLEGLDPCFDNCIVTASAGLIAANTALVNVPMPLPGLYIARVTIVIDGSPGAPIPIQFSKQHNTAASLEVLGFLCASDFSSVADRDTVVCRFGQGGVIQLRTLNTAIPLNTTLRSLIQFKQLSR